MIRIRSNKYGAKKVTRDGHNFDSQAEAARWDMLQMLQDAKKITGLMLHPSFEIVIARQKVCRVILDFAYFDHDLHRMVYEDVKGYDNALSRLKRKLVEAAHGIRVTVIGKAARAAAARGGR